MVGETNCITTSRWFCRPRNQVVFCRQNKLEDLSRRFEPATPPMCSENFTTELISKIHIYMFIITF